MKPVFEAIRHGRQTSFMKAALFILVVCFLVRGSPLVTAEPAPDVDVSLLPHQRPSSYWIEPDKEDGPVTRSSSERVLLEVLVAMQCDCPGTCGITPSAEMWNLEVSSMNCVGHIPAEVCQLRHLEVLSLSGNQLWGEIPPCLGELERLRTISLSDNRLTGPIPSSLGHLPRLYYLDISNNLLTGNIPASLGVLSNLQALLLAGNQLTGPIPSTFCSSRWFAQPHCKGFLYSLQLLDLSSNRLTGKLPIGMCKLLSLRSLILHDNNLEGELPSCLGEVRQLEVVVLSHNRLAGRITDSLCVLTQLRKLNISANQLTGRIPSCLGDCVYLEVVSLRSNRLTGPIPENICTLPVLRYLSLSDNYLTGGIQGCISLLHDVETLMLSNNQFTGPIPSAACQLQKLELLDLSTNQFTGNIPACMCQLASLQQLMLSSNQLKGTLPACAGLNQTLTHLDVSRNQLTGALPRSLCTLWHLVELRLEANSFTGKIPACFCDLAQQLEDVRIGRSLLEGEVPRCFEALQKLHTLDLSGRHVTAELVAGVCRLQDLRHLDLSRSQLTGIFPRCLCSLRHLRSLHLDGNDLTGTLPDCVGADLQQLQTLRLSRNSFTGDLPGSPCSMQQLEVLDLSSNVFSGGIPLCYCQLPRLREVHLGSNKLMGSLPEELCEVQELEVLDVSDNRFTHTLPLCLGNLSSLRALRLANNLFRGQMPRLDGLGKLQELSIYRNRLSGMFPEVTTMTQLKYIHANDNKFHGRFPDVGPLKQLKFIIAQDNQFDGPFPDISGLDQLEYIFIHSNRFVESLPKLPSSVSVALFHGNRFTGHLDEVGAESHLRLLLAVAGNYLAGPATNMAIASKEPLMHNSTTSTFLVDEDGDTWKALKLFVASVFLAFGVLSRNPGRRSSVARSDSDSVAQVLLTLRRCQRILLFQCAAALVCFSIYDRCPDSFRGGRSLLRSSAVYTHGKTTLLAYAIIVAFNGFAFLWIRTVPQDPRKRGKRGSELRSWTQTRKAWTAWISVLFISLLCSWPSLLNSIIVRDPEPQQWMLWCWPYLPQIGTVQTTLLLPAVVRQIAKVTKVSFLQLMVLQGLAMWLLPSAALAVLSDDCYGHWWSFLKECAEPHRWDCNARTGGFPVCTAAATFDVSTDHLAFNGTHFLATHVLKMEDICEKRWSRPEKCTTRLLEVMSTFLLMKLLTASMLPPTFLAACMLGRSNLSCSLSPIGIEAKK
eukprot:TRINITY_DN37072_c0_g1_i1.p1 TRINITY_DN37072_c0_g1~~TRINITY_DN37072_c0_g1_i1.p1  ORF type:complete len:1219 (+),score=106.45 TRINITY_DN37072_c0_g1_i1:216-3872(+)